MLTEKRNETSKERGRVCRDVRGVERRNSRAPRSKDSTLRIKKSLLYSETRYYTWFAFSLIEGGIARKLQRHRSNERKCLAYLLRRRSFDDDEKKTISIRKYKKEEDNKKSV